MERGAPFSPKSNSGLNLEQQSNPNPMTDSRNKGPVVQQEASTVREQDQQYMPMANVVRIMRTILPTQAKISDEAKETIQECVTEFISFVTGEANERCKLEKRRTITAEDILWAMGTLGFNNYVGPLTTFLTRYREIENGRDPGLRSEPLPFHGLPPPGDVFHGLPPPPGDVFHGLPPLPGPPYGFGMVDQSMTIGVPVSGGGTGGYYQNGPDQDGSGGSGAASYSMNGGVPQYDPFGQFK